ncbi:hypothetical protein RGQ15_10605 [Paracoccus sp. MBLB3053]|uniref:Uncharacterized protein n=1 Tax=Paracoccus aurantius TaxID=3073814 RepID=A0ABU2HSL1_9RHOB|nr:hypothetical protein [Paracoccus sp. MBLB3053]MDS9468016.1 hypothetical protein [Paracoccus sp. MBLB3053]
MPRLVKLYLVSIVWGICLALAFTALLIGFDVAGLRGLVIETRGGSIAVAMLAIFHALLFSGVQFGIFVMRMASDDNPRSRGGRLKTTLQNRRDSSAIRVSAATKHGSGHGCQAL